MKLFIVLAAIALSNGAKLDKTYLPPTGAQSSGGSGNFLETPIAGPAPEYRGQNGFSQNNDAFPQSSNAFAQSGNAFPQSGNSFSQSGNTFSQSGNAFPQSGNTDYNNVNAFNNFEVRPERAQAAFERNAAILRQDNQNDGETYSYAYETENGIYAEENGVATNGVEAQGGYSYTGDDGQVYTIRYTADQNGFVPQGDHLPTPPPVPEEILRALEQNARDEAAGIYDDGSYKENQYGSGNQYNSNANIINNNSYNDQSEFPSDDDSVVVNSALLRNSGSQGPARSQSFDSQGSDSQGFNQRGPNNAANKAYLPPFAQRRSDNVAFGSRSRQQTFNPRNGYRY